MCRNHVQMGAPVCAGCQGTMIYGLTRCERTTLGFVGAILAVVAHQSIVSLFGSAGGDAVILVVAGIGFGFGV
jgi:hypothetical protein